MRKRIFKYLKEDEESLEELAEKIFDSLMDNDLIEKLEKEYERKFKRNKYDKFAILYHDEDPEDFIRDSYDQTFLNGLENWKEYYHDMNIFNDDVIPLLKKELPKIDYFTDIENKEERKRVFDLVCDIITDKFRILHITLGELEDEYKIYEKIWNVLNKELEKIKDKVEENYYDEKLPKWIVDFESSVTTESFYLTVETKKGREEIVKVSLHPETTSNRDYEAPDYVYLYFPKKFEKYKNIFLKFTLGDNEKWKNTYMKKNKLPEDVKITTSYKDLLESLYYDIYL